MRYQDFRDDQALRTAADIYADRYGGGFFGGEPDGGLLYESKDGAVVCESPEDAAQVLRDLQSGKPLVELWLEQEDDPELVY